MDIYLLDLESGKYSNLTRTGTIWEEGCKMSPDGKKIFYGSNEGYEKRIDPKNLLGSRWADYWIMDRDGSNRKRLTWFNEPGHPDYLPGQTQAAVVSWCPDGRKLSACIGSNGKLSVRIIELEWRKRVGFKWRGRTRANLLSTWFR
jgi:Tol biopolymer transport system component